MSIEKLSFTIVKTPTLSDVILIEKNYDNRLFFEDPLNGMEEKENIKMN